MRVEAVEAVSFGCLRNQRLEFPEGMTVVFGPNESGKSTWAHAIYFALCGIPARKGKRSESRAAFEDRYRPWVGKEWKVSATVVMDDGRRLEVSQDLARKSGMVIDLHTGKDVTAEFTASRQPGTPDLSLACGVDRDFFRFVALVPQARVLEFVEDSRNSKSSLSSESIRRFMEKASAVSGAPQGIREAMKRLEEARSELGQEGRGGGKPLNVAAREVKEAEEALEEARRYHWLLVETEQTIKELKSREEALSRKILVLEAVLAESRAKVLERRIEEATRLVSEHPEVADGRWTRALEQARRIAVARSELEAAVEGNRPYAHLSEAEIRDELSELQSVVAPENPEFDSRQTLSSLRDAEYVYGRLKNEVAALDDEVAGIPEPPELGTADPAKVQELAAKASAEPPPVDVSLVAAVQEKEGQLARSMSRRRWMIALAVLGALVVVLSVAALLQYPLWSAFGGAVGLGLLSYALVSISRMGDADRELHRLKVHYEMQLNAVEQTRRQVEEALAEAARLGLPTDKHALAELALGWQYYERSKEKLATLQARRAEANTKLAGAAAALAEKLANAAEALRLDGIEIPRAASQNSKASLDPEALSRLEQAYVLVTQALESHASAKERLERRRLLEDALRARQRHRSVVASAVEALKGVGGVERAESAEDTDKLLHLLEEGERRLEAELKAADERQRAYAGLTGGRSFEELHQELALVREAAEELRRRLTEAELAEVEAEAVRAAEQGSDRVGAELEAAKAERVEVSRRLAEKEKEFELRFGKKSESFLTVAEAEENLEEKQYRYEYFRERALVYEKAVEFLKTAERKLHKLVVPRMRDVASKLASEVTSSRYAEVFVDDEKPLVRVRKIGPDGDLGGTTEAELLSMGTAEQIYLIFRMVVADTVATGDSMPLVLDESTVFADSDRLGRLLAVLDAAAGGRGPFEKISQVILFTQEEEVASWARGHLPPENLIELARR